MVWPGWFNLLRGMRFSELSLLVKTIESPADEAGLFFVRPA
jgi:hypothetical protein